MTLIAFPTRCDCGAPAVAQLVFVRDTTEEGRSKPKCRQHLALAIDVWDGLGTVAPEAIAGLHLLTVSIAQPSQGSMGQTARSADQPLPATATADTEADAYARWDGISRPPTPAMRAQLHDLGGPLPLDDEGRVEP